MAGFYGVVHPLGAESPSGEAGGPLLRAFHRDIVGSTKTSNAKEQQSGHGDKAKDTNGQHDKTSVQRWKKRSACADQMGHNRG